MRRDPMNLRQDIKDAILTALEHTQDGEDCRIEVEVNDGFVPIMWTKDLSNIYAHREALSALPNECWTGNMLSRKAVYYAIDVERKYQDDKWGVDKEQSLPGFLVVLRQELEEAERGWAKNLEGRHAPLNEIVQIAATAVACLEKYGTSGSAISTNDQPVKPY